MQHLAARGHTVDVVFSAERDDCAQVFAGWRGAYDSIRHLKIPSRTGWWWTAADPLRALRDYFQYLRPEYQDAHELFERVARRIPRLMRRIFDKQRLRRTKLVDFIDRSLAAIERSLPVDAGIAKWLAVLQPDAVLISPLIDLDYFQLDVLKAARSLEIPNGHLVASWDNLTTKGRIQLVADIVVMWNETQRREAIELHSVPPDRIVVTGAQLHDRWFELQASSHRSAFCARVGGLDPTESIILYVCSSPFICVDETEFVAQWVRAIRSDPELSRFGILIRPHPLHYKQWRNIEISSMGRSVIWPSTGAMPIGNQDIQDYFDSLWYADAVVGINTSVFLEAGIIGRPTLTVRTPAFAGTQFGTQHFRYVVEGGLLKVANTFDEHMDQLKCAVKNDASTREQIRSFVGSFLRPHGLDKPATPFVVEAVESLGRRGHTPAEAAPLLAPLIRAALAPLAALYLRPRYRAVLGMREQTIANLKPSGIWPSHGTKSVNLPRQRGS